MKCRLTNMSKNGHTRTDIVEGECEQPPEIGIRFVMTGSPLDRSGKYDARIVATTPIRQMYLIPGTNDIDFITRSGTNYLWEQF